MMIESEQRMIFVLENDTQTIMIFVLENDTQTIIFFKCPFY